MHRYWDALTQLEKELGRLRLHINPLKTKIERLPAELEPHWRREIRHFRFRASKGKDKSKRLVLSSLDDFFDLTLGLSNATTSDRVMPLAIGRLKRLIPKIDATSYARLESFLFHLLYAAPSTTPPVLKVFAEAKRCDKLKVSAGPLKKCLNAIICESARSDHSIELLWALWGLGAFQQQLGDKAFNAVSTCDHPTAKLLARHLHQLGFAKKLTVNVNRSGLNEKEWLLIHEGRRREYLSHQVTDSFFDGIKNLPLLKDIEPISSRSSPIKQEKGTGTDSDFDEQDEDGQGEGG